MAINANATAHTGIMESQLMASDASRSAAGKSIITTDALMLAWNATASSTDPLALLKTHVKMMANPQVNKRYLATAETVTSYPLSTVPAGA